MVDTPQWDYLILKVKNWFLCQCLALCDPIDCSPPDSSVHGILQIRILEWVAISSSRGSSQPRNRTWVSWVSCFAGRFFTTQPSTDCLQIFSDLWGPSTAKYDLCNYSCCAFQIILMSSLILFLFATQQICYTLSSLTQLQTNSPGTL